MKKEFELLQHKYPNLSSAMCFVKLVKGKKYTRRKIQEYFNKLVEKDDYAKMDKNEIINFLVIISSKNKC